MRKPNIILTGALLALSTSAMAFLSMERSAMTLPAAAQEESSPTADASALGLSKVATRSLESGLYAYSIGGNNGSQPGLYSTDLSGVMTHLWSPDNDGWHMFNGWMYNGHLTGFINHQSDGAYDGIKLVERDFETGKLLASRDLDATDRNTWFTHCDYIPGKEVIFGLGRDEKNWDAMKTMNINDLSDIHNICTVYSDYMLVAMTYNPYDENIYAITRKKQFVRVDQETGAYETLLSLPIEDINSNYKMALTYLPNADEYLFAATLNNSDMSTVYYRIDVESGIVSEVAQLADSNVVTFFVNTEPKDMQAPLRPEFTGMEFPDGALTGTFSFTLPAVLAGGNAATENINWTFYADGEEISSGQAAPGASVDVEAQLTQGIHTIEMASAMGIHNGPSYKKQVFIGNDTPKAPTNVVLTEGNVSWDAVTEGVNNGYLNLADMVYEVYINDEYVGETSKTTLDFTVAPTDAFGKHVATVIAICGDIESEKATSNSAVYGAPMPLDVFFSPNREEAGLFTVIKEDVGNAISWGFDSWDDAFATEHAWTPSSTWLVTPPLNMDDTGVVYAVEFEGNASISMLEDEASLSVYLMSSASGDTENAEKVLLEPFMPSTSGYTKYRAIFCVPEPAAKHIVFKGYSDYLAYQLKVRNISISKTDISTYAPGGVSDLTAVEGNGGALNATVSFTMPTLDLAGREISAEKTVTANVITGDRTVTVSGKPGEKKSAVIETVQGTNTIAVTTAIGDDTGETTNTLVYTGLDRPGMPKDFKAEIGENPRTVNFSWKAPEEGAQGKYFEAKDLVYNIYYTSGWYTYSVGDIPADATEFSFTFPEGTPQNNYDFNIVASNEIGEGVYATVTTKAGTAYELPMDEQFTNSRYTYFPFALSYPSEEYSNSLSIFQTPYNTNEIFEKYGHACVTAFCAGGGILKSCLSFPMFSTEGMSGNVAIKLEVWTGELSAEKMTLFGKTYLTEEPIEIGTIEKGTGWTEVNFTLPGELIGTPWCELYLDSEYSLPDTYTMVYSYSIDTATEVNAVSSADSRISALKGSVLLSGMEGVSYAIYTLDGRLVKRGVAESGQHCVAVAGGAYVVRVGDRTAKVIVK